MNFHFTSTVEKWVDLSFHFISVQRRRPDISIHFITRTFLFIEMTTLEKSKNKSDNISVEKENRYILLLVSYTEMERERRHSFFGERKMFQSRIKPDQICEVSAENGGDEGELDAQTRRCSCQEERGQKKMV
jgi:hypothetical protein